MGSIPKDLISGAASVDFKVPISKAGAYLKKYPAVIVKKDGKYYGVVDRRAIHRAMHKMNVSNSEKVGKITIKAPRITNSTSIYDMAYYFYKSGIKSLPFTSGNKIVGVLERMTLLKMLLSLNVLEGMRTSEAMSTPVVAIAAKANVAQARAAMKEMKVNRLVVLQDSRFAGLLTSYNISKGMLKHSERLPKMKTESYSPSNVPVSSLMEKSPATIEHNRPVSDAVRDMVERKISSLVVMKNREPIGILTVSDVFEGVLARQRVEPSKVFMSGFDANTYQYEDEARESLKSLVDEIERLGGIDVDYITFKLKGHKSVYEMQARLSLGRHGIVTMHSSEHLFEETLNDLIRKLKHRVIKEKDSILTHRRLMPKGAV